MRRVMMVIGGVLGLLICGVVVLWFVQNSSRTATLSLDLYVVKWQLAQPVSVVALIGAGTVGGFLMGVLFSAPSRRRAKKRVRALEQQIAVGGEGTAWR